MTFWEWFRSDGDRLFAFISLASLGLEGTPGIPSTVCHASLIAGVLATAAHQSFFPTAANAAFPPKEIPK